MRITCPECKRSISFDGETPPSELRCSSCGTVLAKATGETVTFTRDGSDETVTYVRSRSSDSLATAVIRTGKPFGDYELLEEIARGGMGVVYRARHNPLNRIVALKMIKAGELADEEDVKRFLAEAEAAANLDHPHIVPVYEVGVHNGRQFFSMGLVEGRNLSDHVKDGPLPPRRAAELIETIAQAVQFAHKKGIVHRDLKPANVLIDENGQPRVTDFGLAKRTGTDSSLTASGQILGTPSYMPPEQAAGRAAEIGLLSDVYSLGAILYALLTGRPPFQTASVVRTLKQVIEDEPASPRQLNAEVDRDLETICLKCLEKDPDKRYASAGELADDVQRYLNREPIAARPLGQFARVLRWAKRYPARAGLLVAATVALMAIVGLGVGFVFQERLKTANSNLAGRNQELQTAKKQIEDSFNREQELSGNLQQALCDANSAKKQAESARDAESKARQAEARAKQTLDRVLYIRRVNLALADWKNNLVARARQLLEQCPQRYRQWEWHYVHRICYPETRTLKHKETIGCVRFSPDGQQLATITRDGKVGWWDIATGRLQRTITLKGRPRFLRGMTFSSDGRFIVSGALRYLVKVWNAEDGRELATLKGHTFHVDFLAISADGKRVASLGGDKMLKLWDTLTGKELWTVKGFRGTLYAVAFSPDGRNLAVAGMYGMLNLWDTTTGKKTLTLTGHTDTVYAVAFSPDGRHIASGGLDGTIRVWDAMTGRELRTLKGHAGMVSSVAFSPNGQRVGSAGFDGTVRVWITATGRETMVLQGHVGASGGVKFSPDGKRIASYGADRSARIWDTTREPGPIVLQAHRLVVQSVAYSPTSNRIATCSWDGTAKIWDPTTGRETLTLTAHKSSADCVRFSPDGRQFATASADKTVKLWDVATGREIRTFNAGHGSTSVAFSPDGKLIASSGSDGGVKIWEITTGQELRTVKMHRYGATSAAFSPDGRLIASASLDKSVKVWEVASGRELLNLKGHTDEVQSVEFSHDGRSIVTASRDGDVKVWDSATGVETLTLNGHTNSVQQATFSPDDKRIASGGWDGTVKIWDTTTGLETLTLTGHKSGIRSLSFSADGKSIASAGWDKTVRIWDAHSGLWPKAPKK